MLFPYVLHQVKQFQKKWFQMYSSDYGRKRGVLGSADLSVFLIKQTVLISAEHKSRI